MAVGVLQLPFLIVKNWADWGPRLVRFTVMMILAKDESTGDERY